MHAGGSEAGAPVRDEDEIQANVAIITKVQIQIETAKTSMKLQRR